ncbi:ImmA/IrrE family metallo-endopeptidase [Streptomyces sp. NPDC001478]
MAIAYATRAARRQIRRDLGLSGVQDLKGLVDAVAASQNKPITIREVPLPLEVSALCARGTDRDIIVVDSQAAELTRLHAILHELFHLWEEHPTDVSNSDLPMTEETVQQLLPGLNPGPVLQVLTRSHYDKAHERRAEAFATVLLQGHLELRADQNTTGFLTSALAHRRSGV